MLAKECLEEFLLDCDLRRLSPRTIKSYKNNISRTLDYINIHFQVIELEEINHQHIRRYMQRLKQKGLSATYANGILKGLRSYFNYAIQEGYLLRSPADKVHWQKEPVKIIETFTNDEVRRMLNVYKRTDFLSVRNKLILAIAFDTGARNSEICEMKTSDIGSNVILIHGKGSKERNVPLTPYVRKVMLQYERAKSLYFSDYFLAYDNYLLSRTGKPLTKEALEYVFKKAGEAASVRQSIRCSPHTARHYYAQANVRNGLDVYSLSRLLGHTNINITKRYLQALQDSDIVEMSISTSPLYHLRP